MAVFGYLAKLKRGLGLAFVTHFLHDFLIKIFLNSLSMDKVSMSCLVSFSRYQTKCLMKFLFRQLMASQISTFSLDQASRQWLTGKKRGGRQKYKIRISRERKELFR